MTTTKLTDTQLMLLAEAARHPGLALIIPPRLKGGAIPKVIGPLLAKGFVEEIEHAPDLPVYRTGEDGSRTALVITKAGLTAIGIEPDVQAEPDEAAARKPARGRKVSERRDKGASTGPRPRIASKAARKAGTGPQAGSRTGTKQAELIAMLERKEGANVAEIMAATGWLAHTVRGAIAGALKKRLGLNVSSDTEEGRGRVYRVKS